MINPELEMGIWVKYIGKDGLEINAELKDVEVNKNFNFNLFSVTKMLKKGYLLSGNKKCMKLKKGAHKFILRVLFKQEGGHCTVLSLRGKKRNSQRASMYQSYWTALILKAQKKR